MTVSNDNAFKIGRILVSLDASPRGRAALKAAVQLALGTSSELQGLFVEDENLVRLASLPFAQEIDMKSATPRRLRSVNMESALRAAAEATQQAFANELLHVNLQWTFRVARGNVAKVSLAAASDEIDLLVIGQQGRSPRTLTYGSLPSRIEQATRVVAVFDGTPSAYRPLELAAQLAASTSQFVSVLVLANQGDDVEKRCLLWLTQENVNATVDQVVNPTENSIIEFARRWEPSILLINRDSQFLSESQVARMIDEFDYPLIVC